MPASPPSPNGHHDDPPAGLKRPAPHPAPSLAARMAEADGEQIEAVNAEMERLAVERELAQRAEVEKVLAANPFLRALPAVYGQAIVEMVAQGVHIGFTRAMEQLAEQEQAKQEQAAKDGVVRHPLLAAWTGNVHQAAQAAMTGMPPPGPQG